MARTSIMYIWQYPYQVNTEISHQNSDKFGQ